MRRAAIAFATAILIVSCAPQGGAVNSMSPGFTAVDLSRPSVTDFATRTRTYTVATTCSIPGCSNAAVSYNGAVVGSLSYTDGIAYFIPSNIAGTVTFLGRTFRDFTGTFSATGANDWIVQGTFSKGHDTLTETFYVYGHSGRGGGTTITNTGGTVVTPWMTPSPTPVPTQKPSPTPKPTPTDS